MRLTTRCPLDRMTIRLVGLSLVAIALPELGYCHTDWRSVERWRFIAILLVPATFGVIAASVISGPLGVRTSSPSGRLVTGLMAAAACLLNPVSLLMVMLAWTDDELHRPRNAICLTKDLLTFGFLDGLLILAAGVAGIAVVRKRLNRRGSRRARI